VRGRASRRGAALAVAAALVLGLRARAAGAPGGCEPPGTAAAGPLPGGTSVFEPADFGSIPEVCPAAEAWLRARGELADASGAPDFFGRLVGSATFHARRPVTPHTWVSLSVDLLDDRWVNDANLVGTGLSFGPATLGFHWTAVDRGAGALALHARALLPLDTARQTGIETGLDLGAAGRLRLPRRFVLDGGLTLAAPMDLVSGQAHARLRPGLLAEAWWARSPALAFFAGASAVVEAAPEHALRLLAPRVGLRGGLRHHLWLAFLAEAPVAGTDRTNLVASAFFGWTP
jgi:hypothetical protein